MSDTAIEWATKVWNPVVGCTHVSEGCDHCYAARLASGRLRNTDAYRGLAEDGRFNGTVRLLPERLEDPLHWRKPARVFVNSMSDLFHDDVPDEFIARVFAVMYLARWHVFQVLTKRPGRMASWVRRVQRCEHGYWTHDGTNPAGAYEGTGIIVAGETWPLPNVWLGTSVENQHWADVRIPKLLETPAAVRFLSCEPLLGPVDLTAWLSLVETVDVSESQEVFDAHGNRVVVPSRFAQRWERPEPRLDWVIVGGESGPDARPMDIDWLRSIVEQCAAAGVPVFVKQDSGPRAGRQGRIPDELWARKEYPGGQ